MTPVNKHSGQPVAGPLPSIAPAHANEGGFTLIELVIAIVVTAILSVVFARLTTSSVDMYDFIRTRKNAIHSSRMALQRISRELRQIAASDSIQYADVDSLAFYKKNGQLITLAWAEKTLRLNSQPLADNIAAFEFIYYDDKHKVLMTPVNKPKNILRIRFKITVNPGQKAFSLFNEIEPRNF